MITHIKKFTEIIHECVRTGICDTVTCAHFYAQSGEDA